MRDLVVQRTVAEAIWCHVTPHGGGRCAVCMAQIITGLWLNRWQHICGAAIKVTCGSWYCRARVARRDGES